MTPPLTVSGTRISDHILSRTPLILCLLVGILYRTPSLGFANFSCKRPDSTSSGFMAVWFLWRSQLCHCGEKAAIDCTSANGGSCVPAKLSPQKSGGLEMAWGPSFASLCYKLLRVQTKSSYSLLNLQHKVECPG